MQKSEFTGPGYKKKLVYPSDLSMHAVSMGAKQDDKYGGWWSVQTGYNEAFQTVGITT